MARWRACRLRSLPPAAVARVVVLEAGQRTGGTALFSGGAIHIEGSRSWEEYQKLVPLADPVLGRVLAERYMEYVQWLAATGAPEKCTAA